MSIDLTQPPAQILVNLINTLNAATLPAPLTTSNAVFGDPQPYGGDGANSVIPFGTTDPATYGAGTVNITYNRIDVSKVVLTQSAPLTVGSATKVSDVLSQINDAFNLNLQASDIIDGPIHPNDYSHPTATLNITAANMIYCGNAILYFAAEPEPLNVAITATTLDGLTPPVQTSPNNVVLNGLTVDNLT